MLACGKKFDYNLSVYRPSYALGARQLLFVVLNVLAIILHSALSLADSKHWPRTLIKLSYSTSCYYKCRMVILTIEGRISVKLLF